MTAYGVAMDATHILIDAAGRPLEAARRLQGELDGRTLTTRLQENDNSISWLLWHTAREIDGQVADLSGAAEVWSAAGFRDRFGLGAVGDGIGYGHTPEEARSIQIEDASLLLEYLEAATRSLTEYVQTLDPAGLGGVIDDSWDPPVTRGARLVSIIDDAAQHIGQAAFIVGALR